MPRKKAEVTKPTKAAKPVAEPSPVPEVIPTEPPIGVYLRFTNADRSFIGVMQSLTPPVLIEHGTANGVHTENEVTEQSEWQISQVSEQEVYAELY